MKSSILVAGTSFLFSGTLLFGTVYLAIANYVSHKGDGAILLENYHWLWTERCEEYHI